MIPNHTSRTCIDVYPENWATPKVSAGAESAVAGGVL